MEQIQQKGSRDGNAIFAQMPGRSGRGALGSVARAALDASNRAGARLDPREDFAKECLHAGPLEKDMM
ncbi:hypothetical protein I3J27_21120 [Bradyrhizobium xenonodulans]|uniref:Uncharacterized protein n=1 Tax=Bradyrhizobium xenonodulans TaxID=2736875 RepID=A0ABY7MB94_9BRAD|nr:hypothetical protein [Bradyrhizobium xenonodulans]WBL75540.1 hypothetical protein I3J27_21120 [Bradyrhizobium xenonodulans]